MFTGLQWLIPNHLLLGQMQSNCSAEQLRQALESISLAIRSAESSNVHILIEICDQSQRPAERAAQFRLLVQGLMLCNRVSYVLVSGEDTLLKSHYAWPPRCQFFDTRAEALAFLHRLAPGLVNNGVAVARAGCAQFP